MPAFKQTQRPTRQQVPNNVYAYGDSHSHGVQGGFGYQSRLGGDQDGAHVSADLLTANGFFGGREESDGSISHGWGASGKAGGMNFGYGQQGQGGFADLQIDSFGGDIGAHLNPNQGANLGATAYFAQAALTAGDIGTGNHDSEARIGAAAGVGAAGRLHWNDADGDGYREYGFGADIGPVTFDVKSEDPVRDFVPGVDTVSSLLGYEGNLTHEIGSGISNAASATASFVGGLFSGW